MESETGLPLAPPYLDVAEMRFFGALGESYR
jgi:hypothetical protein